MNLPQKLSRNEAWLAVRLWYENSGFPAAALSMHQEPLGDITETCDPFRLLADLRGHSLKETQGGIIFPTLRKAAKATA